MKREIERRKINGPLWPLIQSTASMIVALSLVPGTLSPVLADTALTSLGAYGVTGRVTYSGPPEESRYKFSAYPASRFCRDGTQSELMDGDLRVLRTIEVGADGELKGAIVAVTDILDLKFIAEYPGTEVVVEDVVSLPL